MESIIVADKKLRNKKGFTLVEFVVVIAIIAIIATIAIPVMAYTMNTAVKNNALTNARTIENALKEAQISSIIQDSSFYTDIASGDNIDVKDVAEKKAISKAFSTVKYLGVDYSPVWYNGKVYFANGNITIDKQTIDSTKAVKLSATLEKDVLELKD